MNTKSKYYCRTCFRKAVLLFRQETLMEMVNQIFTLAELPDSRVHCISRKMENSTKRKMVPLNPIKNMKIWDHHCLMPTRMEILTYLLSAVEANFRRDLTCTTIDFTSMMERVISKKENYRKRLAVDRVSFPLISMVMEILIYSEGGRLLQVFIPSRRRVMCS